jgi:hypothetical protein
MTHGGYGSVVSVVARPNVFKVGGKIWPVVCKELRARKHRWCDPTLEVSASPEKCCPFWTVHPLVEVSGISYTAELCHVDLNVSWSICSISHTTPVSVRVRCTALVRFAGSEWLLEQQNQQH